MYVAHLGQVPRRRRLQHPCSWWCIYLLTLGSAGKWR